MGTKNKNIENVKLQLRKAEPEDMKLDQTHLKIGQCFWLRSKKTGKFDNAPYILHDGSDPWEIAQWLEYEMIYVPVSSLDVAPVNSIEVES